MRRIMLVMITFTACLMAGCRKDKDGQVTSSTSGPPNLYPRLLINVDSSCITTGNVFTPNADGINDGLFIVAINVVDVVVDLRSANGTVLYSGDLDGAFGPGVLPAPSSSQPPIKLLLSVQGTSTSGHPMSGSSVIYTFTDPVQHCFSSAVAPITPDQFLSAPTLPYSCDVVAASNDLICIQ